MNSEKLLREQLINYLEKPHTHMLLSDAVKDLPEELINQKPGGLPYSFWDMLEHIRISQFDMIDFIQNPNYKEMSWPKEYWPKKGSKATKKMWDEATRQYDKDLETLKEIIKNPKSDLFAPIEHGNGQTIFREVLQIIDHAGYHIGQFIVMRRLANNWGK